MNGQDKRLVFVEHIRKDTLANNIKNGTCDGDIAAHKITLFIDSRQFFVSVGQHIKFEFDILCMTFGTRQATVPETAFERLVFEPPARRIRTVFRIVSLETLRVYLEHDKTLLRVVALDNTGCHHQAMSTTS